MSELLRNKPDSPENSMEGLEIGFITSKRLYNSIVFNILPRIGIVKDTKSSIGYFSPGFACLIGKTIGLGLEEEVQARNIRLMYQFMS